MSILLTSLEEEDDGMLEGVNPAIWAVYQDNEQRKRDPFLTQLHRGMEGRNIGLDNGMPILNSFIHGTHKSQYYLIGAESTTGKSTLGDFMFVFKAWESAKKIGRPIKIIYFSFELGRVLKTFRWCSYFIYIKTGLSLPASYLAGHVNGKLINKYHLKLVLQAYTVIKEMEQDVVIIEDIMHPTKVFETMVEGHFAHHGTVHRDPVSAEELRKNPKKKGYVNGYTENNPDLMTIMIVDHLSLTGPEMGLDTKQVMDKLSRYCIVLRNMFFATPVILQQFSTDMLNTYRGAYGKKTEASIVPNRLDFGDSKATFRDADVVIGGVKPQGHTGSFHSYDVSSEGLGNYFVAWYLMKNRHGSANCMLPIFMDHVAGVPFDLPPQPNPFNMQPWIDKAAQLDEICQQYSHVAA